MRGAKRHLKNSMRQGRAWALAAVMFVAAPALAVDVVPNGTFDSNLNSWTNPAPSNGSIDWDSAVFGSSSGSMRFTGNQGRNAQFSGENSTTLSGTINSTDTVLLSFYWYKASNTSQPDAHDVAIYAVLPGGGDVLLWSDSQRPLPTTSLGGNVNNLDVSSLFSQTGTYQLKVTASSDYTNNKNMFAQFNIDDLVVDAIPAGANNAPTVTSGATVVSVSPVNRFGAETTIISTAFNDADVPGVGAFNVTFKIREPNNSTELTLVNNLPNGTGGLTITDQGGGNYTASYSYNPSDVQTLGLYDLYFEVTDGTDNVVDGYANNQDELEINEVLPNNPPVISPGNTAVSVSPVNRYGTDSTVISTTFSDSDDPGVAAFNVSFKIREPDNSTELTLVNNQSNGAGGLTITDNGGGSYTASYIYNPDDAQNLGLYDLYCEVSDGTDNDIDDYPVNQDELQINEILPNNAPTLTPGTTAVSISPVNRYGTNTTNFTASFTDLDVPGVAAFNISLKIREPNNTTEVLLVDNLIHNQGGLTVTHQGGGNYTANYTYDPADAQTLGLYDLYFEVSDGTDSVIDGYTGNLDELEINEILPNNAPTVTAGATQVSVSPVNRYGTDNTVISTVFSDADAPGVGAFNVTFKIREPNDSTELTLVNNLANGSGGLAITDQGGGNYTASYTYDPGAAQTLGLYDLYFEVTDGEDNAADDYLGNLDELQINEILPNNAPVVTPGATTASVNPVNRFGSATTVISTDFTDADQPAIGEFTVTLKAREPDNSTEVVMVGAQTHGNGGLTITDHGGGSYTASYTWNPDDAQTLGLYDLHCDVSDAEDTAIDGYANNDNELEIIEALPNNAPVVVAGATQVSVSPVNRFGVNSTVVSATFSDTDDPGVGAFNVSFRVREPDNSTVVTLVDNQTNGVGGLTITNEGGGSYTASYTYDPADAQAIGLYDLQFEVFDGADSDTDAYSDNLDELEINEILPNAAPVITPGATTASVNPVNRFGTATTVLSTDFTDTDEPGVGAFNVTLKVREPNDITELILVDDQANGAGGLAITDNGGGSYTASYTWNPADAQTLGLYDLHLEVSDAEDTAVDGYANNTDELQVVDVPPNNPPVIAQGATQVSVSPVNRFGTDTTVLSTTFTDVDDPGLGAFNVSFRVREPDNSTILTLVDNQTNGNGGLTITDNGGGSYTASYTWNPDDAQNIGLYDLQCEVFDGADTDTDAYSDNLDELEINETLPNNPPLIVAGATTANVNPVNRVGLATTVLSTDFTDADAPGVAAYTVIFKLREPDNSTELTLVNNQPNGSGGLTITDNGGGSYTASYTWNPDDAQTLGLYDMYCEVRENLDVGTDGYANNDNELEIVDVQPNNPPVIAGGATQVDISPVNRFGAGSTVISTTFTDADEPGAGAFTVSFRVREPDNTTVVDLVDGQTNGNGGLTITDDGGGSYTASYTYNPADAQTLGYYDLQCEVFDGSDTTTDTFNSNAEELQIIDIQAPVIAVGATTASVNPVNRFGSATTLISTDFSDGNSPPVGAFTVTLKAREPDNSTEIILVDGLADGNGGLAIANQGNGNYTAQYLWNPDDAQTIGLYDLYCEISDADNTAIDGYANNADELEIVDQPPNNPPVIVAGATQVNVTPVDRYGTDTTILSTTFNDADDPGVGAFNVSFKLRLPNNSTSLTLVDNQTNGNGGLTITDNGSGSYTASYTYDPDGTQALGLYDLQCEVFDGADTATDLFNTNLDELEIIEILPNSAPVIAAGATTATKAQVNRIGTANTVIYTEFSDDDVPGSGAFTVTFKVRAPDNSTELVLVNALTDGNGGLSITDEGLGNYTASFTWNPDDAQTVGLYDLYCEISDGEAAATDVYAGNLDEVEIFDAPPNNVPQVTAGVTAVSKSPVNRYSTDSTVVTADFSDADIPGVGAFFVTFKIREPDDSSEVTLVDNRIHGTGGLTITDNGSGSYTATYTYNPSDLQTLGLYDLTFEVSDGTDTTVDPYSTNLDELEIYESLPNNNPVIAAGSAQVSVSPLNRLGSSTTVLSADFTDPDIPGIGAFTVTLKVREPDNSTEILLIDALQHGTGGLVISYLGGDSYRAQVNWDPADTRTIGLYDLFCEVSDGLVTVADGYANNLDELEVIEAPLNNVPTFVAGATQVSVSPVNRYGTNTTEISADFTDSDSPGLGAFTVSFKIREPSDIAIVTLVAGQTHGNGGLTIIDNGGGSYTATYTYDPSDIQAQGLYDLYCEVSDGQDSAVDGYEANTDELEINEFIPNSPPVILTGETRAIPSPVNRLYANTTLVSANFSDDDEPGIGAFNVTIKIREPNDSTELTLVANQPHGSGGLSIIDLGSGEYRATYSYDPADNQTLGLYDLYCEVTDGEDVGSDGYANNIDELEIAEYVVNNPPTFVVGTTAVSPSSLDRIGAATTEISSTFNDADQPGINAFTVTFRIREPFGTGTVLLADGLQHGQGGLTITDDGGGDYTARISWDPSDNEIVGYYDLSCLVSDGSDESQDVYDDNLDELLITNGGENSPPVVPTDNTFATPAGVERIGTNVTTLTTTFQDADVPGTGAFTVTFRVRYPDDSTELTLADNLGHGSGGLTITDDGGGIYTARIDWEPGDGQDLGLYDLYFSVSDGSATAVDGYLYNENELEVYDGISNQPVTLVTGSTAVQPSSITRLGSDYTMIEGIFADADMPGPGGFTVTFKVRDASSTEYTIVNAAANGEQGLRILSLGGNDYQASVLWDPPVGQVTGDYDLFFSVTDIGPSTATDDFIDNQNELAVTANGIAGDGYLLRRNHDTNSCGGANAACHNLVGHQGSDCLVCHVPHGTKNIYMIRETIQTPSSGSKPVVFKTLGIGDPHNDPDPVPGDPGSGVEADDSDGVYTGVCEVCHTATKYHRNDGSQTNWGHKNAQECSGCHTHDEGFPSSGGESSGGSACTCHSAEFNPMNSSTSSYHHQMNSNEADYTISSRTCLTCHVDHDIFSPDLNAGFGTRAKNLRVDITSTVTTGTSAVLSDSDYQSSGTGGICLSCHTSQQTKGYVQPDGSTTTPALSKTGYDAATSAHNYEATSTFTSDGSTFRANCSKCHNGTIGRNYQDAGNQFGTHDSPYRTMVDPLGVSSPSDPLEEKFCLECHSTVNNPNAGSNQDYYGVQPMSTNSLRIEDAMGQTYGHPTVSVNGTHDHFEDASNLGDGNRHAECVDCHNVHEADQGTHDGSTNLVSNALKGAWGVEPTSWPAAPATDNANTYATPAGYTRVEPAQKEYQICLKCHSDFVTLPAGSPNLAEEINPNYVSMHGIVSAGTNSFCNSTTMNEPWGTSAINYCSDCHRSGNTSDPEGPHGSNIEHLLVETITSDDVNGTPLCMVCHKASVYWDGSAASSRFSQHPATKGAHQLPFGCFACHMWEFASNTSVPGVNHTASLSAGKIHVHGMNKRWTLNERLGSAGLGQLSDAFVDGYMADVDYVNKECWAEVCKTHSGSGY